MKILLDTHIFLWFITANKRLSDEYIDSISNKNNDVYLSVASIWECIIKQQIGKLNFPQEASEYLSQKRLLHNINSLSIDENSLKHLAKLPKIHNDPFDRIIICQSLEHKMVLITVDKKIKKYKRINLQILQFKI